jgi:hypothetical protein
MRIALICLALVFSACSKPKPAAPEAPKRPTRPEPPPPPQPPVRPVTTTAPNACAVLDEDVARRHLGDDAKLTRHAQLTPQMSRCQWTGGKGVANVIVGDWSALHTKNASDVPVPGLGDEAYETPTGLVVRKGEHALSVTVVMNPAMLTGAAAKNEQRNEKTSAREIAPDLIDKL